MIQTVTIGDSYKWYRQNYQNTTSDKASYLRIIDSYMKLMVDKLFEGYDIKLGARLGTIAIKGKKVTPVLDKDGNIKGIAPNWGATKKLQAENEEAKKNRTIVYCFNEHSNGIKYSFKWSKVNVVVVNKTFYTLILSRRNRRNLSKLIQEGKEYQVIPEKINHNQNV